MSRKESDKDVYNALMKKDDSNPVNFEVAIEATGFGKFNILLMFILIPCSFAQIIEQIGTSYVIPIAQCDLELTLEDKGIVNSAGYTGMMVSGVIWGYICDTYGRRKVIVSGFLLNSLCYVMASLSQNFSMLLISRLLCGAMFTGPFSAVTSYVAEFHSSSRRAKVQLVRGAAAALGMITLPLIGWAILPTNQQIFIMEYFIFRSWNIFLLICSLPAFISSIIFLFMPESPKFLMTQGKNGKALHVFQMVHRINSGHNNYPIKCLIEEKEKSEDTAKHASIRRKLHASFASIKPLFKRPYIFILLLVCCNAGSLIMGIFGLKLWYPQLLQSINDYERGYGSHNLSICNVVRSMTNNKNDSTVDNCTVNLDNASVYINSALLGTIHMTVFIIAGLVVNRLGKKTLVGILTSIAAVCPFLIYFISNSAIMATLFPVTLSLGELSANILLTTTMEIFPTTFRLTAVNFHLLFVRIATSLANIIFPYLIMSGCLSLLLFISLCVLVTVILTRLIPSTENKALQ